MTQPETLKVVIERTFLNDNQFGLQNEPIVYDKLKIFFNDYEMVKTANKYCAYDFESPNMKYELKSRRCASNKYLTTIIPTHKADVGGNICFVFSFTDGLFYIYYDFELFCTFNKRNIGVFRDGHWGKAIPHFEIPICLLQKINI